MPSPKRKAAPKGKLPSVDRSRALPTRTGWSLKKTLVIAVAVAIAVTIYNGKTNEGAEVPAPPTIVEPR